MSRRLYLPPGDVTQLLTNLAGPYERVIAQNSRAFQLAVGTRAAPLVHLSFEQHTQSYLGTPM